MEYKGYFAKVEFDDDADIFHGEVINLRDVITFEGETVKEIKQAFHDSIDDYLVSIRKWLFSPISALGSNFNPRNTSMYSCG